MGGDAHIVEFGRDAELRHVGIEITQGHVEITHDSAGVEFGQTCALLIIEPRDRNCGIGEINIGRLDIQRLEIAVIIAAGLDAQVCQRPLASRRRRPEFICRDQPAIFVAEKLEPAPERKVSQSRDRDISNVDLRRSAFDTPAGDLQRHLDITAPRTEPRGLERLHRRRASKPDVVEIRLHVPRAVFRRPLEQLRRCDSQAVAQHLREFDIGVYRHAHVVAVNDEQRYAESLGPLIPRL